MSYKLLLAAGAALAASAAVAQKVPQGSPFITSVTACQGIADPAQRLACYDASVAKLKTATEQREVVVVDKEQVRKTRRSLFGFSFPDLPAIFGGGDGKGETPDEPEFRQIESTIVNVGSRGDGKWIMVLPDGATWQYAEINRYVEPTRGDKILIKKAALGSFMANIDGQRAVRVERIR
jgi:hypothetical protein